MTRFPLKKRQGGPYNHFGPFGEGKTSCFSPVLAHDCSILRSVVYPALHYPVSSFFARHHQIPNTCSSVRAFANKFSTNMLRTFLQRPTVGYLPYSYHTRLPPSLIAVTVRTKISDTERMVSSFNIFSWFQRRFWQPTQKIYVCYVKTL